MERDFMGLVKEEAVEGCKEPVFSKSSAIQWPLSNGFDGFNNYHDGEIQKSMNLDRQNGTHFSMTAYPVQHHHDTTQPFPVTMNNPFFRPHFSGAPIKQHPVLPSYAAGTAESCSKAACAPPQLTIFYGGMVNVYDDISPEKAQAIMFLAGNGAALTTPRQWAQTQRTQPGDGVHVSQPVNAPPCSAVSSPMSVTSYPMGQTTIRLTIKDEAAKTGMSSLGKVMQSAIPQARKASLARFLEKRKERVMAAAPYSLRKGSSDCAATGSGGTAILAAIGQSE